MGRCPNTAPPPVLNRGDEYDPIRGEIQSKSDRLLAYGKVDPGMALFNAAHLMSLNPEVSDIGERITIFAI